jgi:hypothetical protein
MWQQTRQPRTNVRMAISVRGYDQQQPLRPHAFYGLLKFPPHAWRVPEANDHRRCFW